MRVGPVALRPYGVIAGRGQLVWLLYFAAVPPQALSADHGLVGAGEVVAFHGAVTLSAIWLWLRG